MRLKILSFILFLFLFFSFHANAQTNAISGSVVDAETGEPLAFVTVIDLDNKMGTVTDIDGVFNISSASSIRSLRFSYVGYEPDTIQVTASDLGSIELRKKQVELNEFTVYPGENPAHRIIKLAVENRKQNDPNFYEEYQYNSYNKLIATFVPSGEEMNTSTDSSMRAFAEKQHLFLLESSTVRSFMAPNRSKEVVTGTRVSGFENPAFSFVATELQPFGFYDTYVELFDKEYLNPISQGSWNRYLFEIKDTLLYRKDSTFIIQYQPKRKSNFEGLKGLLYINTDGYAIENVIAENYYEGINSFRIQQKYQRVRAKWFPQQLNFDLIFNDQNLLMFGRSYINEIDLNPGFDRQDFDNVLIEIPEESGKREAFFWDTIRVTPLDSKELETYQVLDSIGEKHKFEEIAEVSESLARGYVPLGYVNLDIDQLLRYSQFEGVRLGLGLHSSDKISKWASIGGSYAYGFGDQEHKYSGYLKITPYDPAEMEITFSHAYDVYTPGSSTFIKDQQRTVSDNWRRLLSTWMNYNLKNEVSWSFRALKYAQIQAYAKHEDWTLGGDYQYRQANDGDINVFADGFSNAEAGIRIKYAHGEKLVKTKKGLFSLGTDAPVLWFNYGRGFQGIEGSQFDYHRLEAKVFKAFKTRVLGEFSLSLSAGTVSERLPAPYLFVANGTFEDDIRIVVQNTFQTMRLFEFIGQDYASLHYRHRLWRWFTKYNFTRPEFFMSHSLGIGTASEELLEDHAGFEFKSMEDGFIESGVQVDHLLRLEYLDAGYFGLGFGAFYRYGANQLQDWKDNIALKFALTFEL